MKKVENPICAFSTNRYTDEDRKVLCKGCDERCEYSKKEPKMPKVFENMLNAITPAESLGISPEEHDKIVDECIFGKEEPVSDGLEVAAEECIEELLPETALDAAAPFALEYVVELLHKAFKAGAEWQKKQIMKDAIDCFVGPREGWFYIGPLIPQHYYNLEKDEEIKMVIIKE
jgi:hypothetical protein